MMSDLNLELYWPFLIGVISNKVSNSASITYRRLFKVGMAEWRVLSCLHATEALTAKAIGVQVGQDKAAISRALNKLEKDGYVIPSIPKTVDGITSRKVPYRLTDSGESLYQQIQIVAQARNELLKAVFSPAEQAQFTRLLQRMHQQLPTLLDAMEKIGVDNQPEA